ncbi:MAG: hypothetical protein ACFE89_11795, partial [Candidatus Hodarchaeota archaeon]
MGKNRWLIGSLLFLFILPVLPPPSAALPTSQSPPIASLAPPGPPPPYGPFAPVGQYNGSSNPTNILATYNKSLNVKTPTNDTQDFTVDLAPDWSSFMEVSITEITTSSLIKIIDTNTTDISNEETISNQYLAISVQITNSCIIANFTAYLRVLAAGAVLPSVYNATNDGLGRPEPDANVHYGQVVGVSLPAHYAWYTFTFASGSNYLNHSQTYNGYFFIVLVTVGVNVRWIVTEDSVSGDGGRPYLSVDGNSWSYYEFGGQPADFLSTVGLEPLTTSPSPSGISMVINGTSVQDVGGNSGQWTRTFTVIQKATRFDVFTTWPALFNFRYNASLSYTFEGVPSFQVTEG